ncbi:hypothetical protein [Dyadobacter sp. MSC1_007]|uniref:hypothetical protein n=1 Tax=Dyadobacter sp. MSC1_007 TaxID=2909264 RepID=UPI0020302F51|nr:hypothetical protein [Dyadobacter sp. MSC1_007]
MLSIPVIIGILYAWAQTVVTGALLFDTFVLYPNVFADVPKSLSTSMEFLSRASPGSFLPGLGGFTLVTGLVTLWIWRRHRRVFLYFVAGFLLLVALDFAASVLYFWPRNTIMFTEGLKVHSAEKLLETSRQFRSGHWVRLAGSLMASVCAMLGLVAAVRQSSSKL